MLCLVSFILANLAHGQPAALTPVKPSEYCVTSGKIDRGQASSSVRVPEMRAVVERRGGSSAELRFTYRGPSRNLTPLASGEARRQLGLKLRAQDGCNLVYVMWRLEPISMIVISVKRNPGRSTHAQCGANGYKNLKQTAPLPAFGTGEPHVLRADIEGRSLVVKADGAKVWEGPLPEDAFSFDGPVGLRSDNVQFDFELLARPGERISCQNTRF